MNDMEGYKAIDDFYKSMLVKDHVQCSAECMADMYCVSYSSRPVPDGIGYSLCQLYDVESRTETCEESYTGEKECPQGMVDVQLKHFILTD